MEALTGLNGQEQLELACRTVVGVLAAARPLQGDLGVTYKTAWTRLDRLRQAVAADPLLRRLHGEVAIDDTSSGGHRKDQRGAAGKTPLLGIRQRGAASGVSGCPALMPTPARPLSGSPCAAGAACTPMN